VIYKPFSVVTVPFPFTDREQTKHRPALVLSHINHQHETNHITLLMITSAKQSFWNSDYSITDLKSTGLHSPSIVRQKLFTIDSRLVIEDIGILSLHDIKNVKRHLHEHLEFV
jgi:mRNA interferase MazF